MYIDTDNLQTLKSWSASWTRSVPNLDRSETVKTGCVPQFAHALFDPENNKPVAKRVREQYTLVQIDGIKFVIENSKIPAQQKRKK